jgi:predicted dehydrogenase
MSKVTAILLGAGGRGMGAYASYALKHPNELEFIAVAEPNKERREKFKKLHNLPDSMCFESWEELLAGPKLADAALICTQDRMHFKPTVMAIEKGYHILLEKPISPNPKECLIIGEKAKEHNKVLSVCHVLRYTSFFATLKKLLDDGRIGRLISIQHNENVGYWHQAHSFVRGNWRNSTESSPMILQKSCHDTDILLWLVGAECVRVSSFGSLTHFKSECAPEGAPMRCLDGCPEEDECPYYAPKIYLTDNTGWPTSVISEDTSIEARTKALKDGPYGRCVYHCDNDVVDHQVVNMEFSNEVTVAFTMCAFSNIINRTIKLMGTRGEIRGDMHRNEIEITDFNTGTVETIKLQDSEYGHGGGDYGIMRDFLKLVQQDGKVQGRTSASVSVQSHMIAFAAEKARVEKKIINIKEFMEEVKNN